MSQTKTQTHTAAPEVITVPSNETATMWRDRDRITGQPIGRVLLRLAVPAVLSTFFTVVFEVVDMFWIGKLGPVSIAALSTASFYVWLLRGLGLVVATGSIAMIARRTGERDENAILTTIVDAVGATFLFSLGMIAIFFPIGMGIFQWIRLDPEVAATAVDYSIVFLSGLIFVYMMMTFEFMIRGLGDARTPMFIMGIALFLNAVLDPIFIFPLGLGVKGAAFATILAQAVGAVLMAVVIFQKVPALRDLVLNRFTFSLKRFYKRFISILSIGGPAGLSDAGFSLIYLVLGGIVSIFGKEPLAAVGIAHRLEALLFFICLGFSMAVAPMVGQYLGAGEPEKAKQAVYLSLKITAGILLGISVLYFLFAPLLFSFFTRDRAIIAYGAGYLRIVATSEVFLALEVVLGGAFAGAGDNRPPFFITFPITLLRIPAAYFLAVSLGWGVRMIWVVIAVTTMMKGVFLLYWFNKGNWMKKKV